MDFRSKQKSWELYQLRTFSDNNETFHLTISWPNFACRPERNSYWLPYFRIYSPISALKIMLLISCWTKAFVLLSYFRNLLAKYLLKYSNSSPDVCPIEFCPMGVSSFRGNCKSSSALVSISPSSIWKSCSLNSPSDEYSSGSYGTVCDDSSDISSAGSVLVFFWKNRVWVTLF